MKKVLAFIIALVMIFSITVYAGGQEFNDVKSTDWFYSNLTKMIDLGIVNGYEDGSFRPKNTLKYEEYIKLIVTAMKNEVEAESGEFWYKPYMDCALANNYILLTDYEYIGKNITRKQMAEIIYNVISYSNDGIVKLNDREKEFVAGCLTDLKVTDEKLLHIAHMGVINGYPDKTFKPNNCLTRAEATTVVLRLIDSSIRTPIKIVLPKTLADFPEPDLEYLRNYPCHVWNESYTVAELNEKVSVHNDTYEISQVAIDFMDLVSNIDYKNLNTKDLKNSLIYHLHSTVEYNKIKYSYLSDGEYPINDGHNWFDLFLNKYFKDIKGNNIQIQGKFYTDSSLSIFVHGKTTSRGIFRFKIVNAKDLNLIKQIMFIRDTEREKKDNLYDEIDYGGYDNSRYIKNGDINLKLNTWYEMGVDVVITRTATTGAYVYENYDTSDYSFEYMCPLYIKELK